MMIMTRPLRQRPVLTPDVYDLLILLANGCEKETYYREYAFLKYSSDIGVAELISAIRNVFGWWYQSPLINIF